MQRAEYAGAVGMAVGVGEVVSEFCVHLCGWLSVCIPAVRIYANIVRIRVRVCVYILYSLLLCTHLRWVPSDVLQWGCETCWTRTCHFGGIHLSHDLLPVGLLHRTR